MWVEKADEAAVRQFVQWAYEPPYAVYNTPPEAWEESVRYFLGLGDECCAIYAADELVGYVTYGADGQVAGGTYPAGPLDIGLGVRPDLTGKGEGGHFLAAALEYGRRTYHPTHFRVTIAAFNERAQRLVTAAGFVAESEFLAGDSGRPFIIFTRPA